MRIFRCTQEFSGDATASVSEPNGTVKLIGIGDVSFTAFSQSVPGFDTKEITFTDQLVSQILTVADLPRDDAAYAIVDPLLQIDPFHS
jgi:hypothetical protein